LFVDFDKMVKKIASVKVNLVQSTMFKNTATGVFSKNLTVIRL